MDTSRTYRMLLTPHYSELFRALYRDRRAARRARRRLEEQPVLGGVTGAEGASVGAEAPSEGRTTVAKVGVGAGA